MDLEHRFMARGVIRFGMARRISWLSGTALLGAVFAVAGCAPPLWESEFRAERGVGAPAGIAAPLAKDAPVRVREVPWERVDATLRALNGRVASSDVHPDDWTPAQHAEAQAQLLRGLQISEDPAIVRVLGRSVFRTTDRVSPDDGSLAAFARRLGADTVVWTSTYVGKAQVVREKPVDEYRTVTAYEWDRSTKRWRDRRTTESATYWVPIVVEEDQYAWMAYFLRTVP